MKFPKKIIILSSVISFQKIEAQYKFLVKNNAEPITSWLTTFCITNFQFLKEYLTHCLQ